MKYTGILFDLDGTLLNTLEDIRDSLNRALAVHNLPPRTVDEVRAFVGSGSAKLVERAVPQGCKSGLTAQVLAYYRVDYAKNCNVKTRPYDGIKAVMERFEAIGIPMAVVSNKPDAQVKMLAAAHFPGLIRIAVGESEGIRRKPAPDLVLSAMEALGTVTNETVYVGDSEVDVQTAKNAQLDCISVDWGFRERQALITARAETIISSPEELLELI